eukprot:scaffold3279_cov56-Attheya_sp.AAC.1
MSILAGHRTLVPETTEDIMTACSRTKVHALLPSAEASWRQTHGRRWFGPTYQDMSPLPSTRKNIGLMLTRELANQVAIGATRATTSFTLHEPPTYVARAPGGLPLTSDRGIVMAPLWACVPHPQPPNPFVCPLLHWMYVEDRTLANDPYSTAATAAAAHKEQEHLRWIVTLQQSPHHHIIYIYSPPFIRAVASTLLFRSYVKTKLTHTKRYFESHDTISRDVAGGWIVALKQGWILLFFSCRAVRHQDNSHHFTTLKRTTPRYFATHDTIIRDLAGGTHTHDSTIFCDPQHDNSGPCGSVFSP